MPEDTEQLIADLQRMGEENMRLKAKVAELEAALKWIVNCTDSEMGDGDGARTVAKDALN